MCTLNDRWLIRCDVGRALTINDLSDDDLLAIFDFYVFKLRGRLVLLAYCNYEERRKIESWQPLVHVCRRWRGLVFDSPRRLDLHVCCTPVTPVDKSLDVWPTLPLVIVGSTIFLGASIENVIAKLHSDRITQIQLDLYRYLSRTEDLWTAMKVPFPELEALHLVIGDMQPGHVLPDLLLGGSAQRLRYLTLSSIPFPGLPNLLLSATQLVYLSLSHVPYFGYVSPQVMATCLSTLTSLESFQLDFAEPHDQNSPPPPPATRFVLLALNQLWFRGPNKYLEDLVSRIDTPRLYQLVATFDDVDLDTSQLNQFIDRTPRFEKFNEARVIFHAFETQVTLQSHPEPSDGGRVKVIIPCEKVLRQQILSLAQICTTSLRLLSRAENLYIYEDMYYPPVWKGKVENSEWLRLLLPFIAVENLYLSKKVAPRIAPALQELTGARITEVVPALQNVFVERVNSGVSVQIDIAQFISARQLTSYPITVSVWENRDVV